MNIEWRWAELPTRAAVEAATAQASWYLRPTHMRATLVPGDGDPDAWEYGMDADHRSGPPW